jgi:hypothetical protein
VPSHDITVGSWSLTRIALPIHEKKREDVIIIRDFLLQILDLGKNLSNS